MSVQRSALLRVITLGSIVWAGLAHGAPTAAPAAPAANSALASTSAPVEAMRSAVSESAMKLGALEPWQKKILEDELLQQPQELVREYRQAGAQFKVSIDEPLLKRLLVFYGPKVMGPLGNEQPRVAARVESEEGCASCASAVAMLRKLFNSRLDHRMVKPLWIKDSELPQSPPSSADEPELPVSDSCVALKVRGDFRELFWFALKVSQLKMRNRAR